MRNDLGTERDDRYSDSDAEYYRMTKLYEHQKEGIRFLEERKSAGLFFEMGLGKTRCALVAAQELFVAAKIDRMLVLAPAAVRYSWRTEIDKLEQDGMKFIPCVYEPKKQHVLGAGKREGRPLPVLLVSYALLPQKRHVEALLKWCTNGKTVLVCDESSFLKNRAAKQTKSAAKIARSCLYRWLLTGTPVANSPLDLYGQSLVMSNGARGPLSSFKNWWSFRARYATLAPMHIGRRTFSQVVGYQNIDELTKRFAPYVLRRTKEECLDLPAKTYVVREVQLSESTWKIYQELRRDALLALPDADVRPEPNAAVRILRLCQLTSGHVGVTPSDISTNEPFNFAMENTPRDVSSEKLDWLVEQILDGELPNEKALIVWCRWRRERERLYSMLDNHKELYLYQIYGGQSQNERDFSLKGFTVQDSMKSNRNILLAQPHAGGYGLNLTAASTAVYLSNDFSYTTRIQSEDRCHRIGQTKNVTYVDVVAVGPKGQKTVDHHVLECLRAKKDIATQTCAAWRKVLSENS